jgi:hypothetical protein
MRGHRTRFPLLLLLVACAREESPADAYREFTRAAAARDADRAFALQAPETQRWLDERASIVARAAPGVVPADGRQLLLGDAALSARKAEDVIAVRESRDAAVLEVTVAGGDRRRVEMVRKGGWRVRIPPPKAP